MPVLAEVAFQNGLIKKRYNAVTALLCGLLPAAILFLTVSPTWKQLLLGIVAGALWGNAFEYAYHRWLLHRPGVLGKAHLDHHANVGKPEEAEHVALGKSPANVVLLFVLNGALALPLDLLFHFHLSAGIFLGWSLYLITTEEIHWRIHMGGHLPAGLRFAREYHMRHHQIPSARFNIYLPFFDLLMGSGGKTASPGSDIPVRLRG